MKIRDVARSIRMTVLCSVLSASVVMAGNPAVCTAGYYDATCTPKLARTYQPPPVCSTAAGWTTVSSARWIGSQYTSPQCNYQSPPACSTDPGWTTAAPAGWTGSQWTSPQCSYQAPPSCPGGFHQTAAASWNGASWVGQQCQPDATNFDPVATCTTAMTAQGYYDFNSYQELKSPQPPKRDLSWMAHGPWTSSGDSCGDMTHLYIMYCLVNTDGSVYSIAGAPQPENITCGGQGG